MKMRRGRKEHVWTTDKATKEPVHTTDYFSKAALDEEAKADVCCGCLSWKGTKRILLLLVSLAATVCFGLHIYLNVKAGGLFYFAIPAAVFSVLTSMFAIHADSELKQLNTMRQLQTHLRSEVNRFENENNILVKNVDELEQEVHRLKPVERKLSATVGRNGDNVDELVDLVGQNRVTLDEMKVLLKAEVVQDILAIVMDSDTDGDFNFSNEEVDILVLRLSVVDGVESINAAKMKELVAQYGGTLTAVLKLVRYILDEDNDLDDPVVKIDPMSRRRREKLEPPALQTTIDADDLSSSSSEDSLDWQQQPQTPLAADPEQPQQQQTEAQPEHHEGEGTEVPAEQV